ncbi:amidohydrolase [Corynebacterium sp. p3-SID1145]|uniref:nitrilase-related carbon-nitrogen hydrolase n=1 Tax=unclassified Corynebacterium TaxID=2624378 RepID=UPI0021AAEE81|nr:MULTISPECIES: nitrilase-related carbon-nitrogen hydrolase [unclassified Corynebacterium]MCT1452108.1 amidohydrolase [Corynebacterium sp. p3-SID1145]MCT1461810.1 amidohydrolase [Corynebacterium sp. p3-SID1140]
MRIGLVQFTAGPDTADNLTALSGHIRTAADKGATLIVCPEASSQAFESGPLQDQAEGLDGAFATGLRQLADELGVTIVAGMFRPGDGGRVRNTALITNGRDLHEGYDKIHAFDTESYRESDNVEPGTELHTFGHEIATVGCAICFDIRFPDQFQELARRGAHIVVVPTSWAGGENKVEEWTALTRARALDAGVFVLAPDQANPEGATGATSNSDPLGVGHSMAVAPNGTVLAQGGFDEEVIVVDIDPAEATRRQAAVPIL